jgi:glycosyltransferase involved in cell wall biosynthesis
MNQNTLTTVIISKNESERIQKAIKSVLELGLVLVVDNNSTDNTKSLASGLGAHVVTETKNNVSELRTRGLREVHTDWILYLDADETVTPALAKEIRAVIGAFSQNSSPRGYFIERKNYYLGSLWPTKDKMERLFYTSSLSGWKGRLHESPVVQGHIATLGEPLIHDTHRTLTEMVEKTNTWSSYEAELRMEAHHPPVVWWRLIRVMGTAFWKSFIREQGYKAGTVGWIESIFQTFSMFITYAKLWEMQVHGKK